jgi:hypothetical protein
MKLKSNIHIFLEIVCYRKGFVDNIKVDLIYLKLFSCVEYVMKLKKNNNPSTDEKIMTVLFSSMKL